LVSLSFSSKAVDCTTDTVGLCTPTIEQIIEEVVTETIEFQSDGILTTTTTETTTTTTTVSNEDSGDILDGNNGYVTSSKEGDMDIDWGGQGPATMPSGSGCYNLGTDKCAQITGSGNSTSTMGVSGMGTTFINTVDISDLNIKYGGQTNYSIKVDKRDAQDSIYMHITGKNGNTSVFSGTDILSASGTNSGFNTYTGGFDFSGSITTVIIEVGGRDINLAIGPLFDDVTVNVLYNTINTIVEQTITSVEMFVALNPDVPDEVIDVVEDIFDANMPVESDAGFDFEPIEVEEVSYESVEIEIAEIEIEEIQVVSVDVSENVEVSVADVESEIEMELEMELDDVETETNTEPESTQESPTNSEDAEPTEEKTEESTQEPKQEKTEVAEAKEETTQEESQDDEKQESSKQKAAKKVLKKIDDKKRYDSTSQLKTLVVMQVLGNTKSFFSDQQELNDRANFFTNLTLPDAVISDNNIAGYLLFGGSNQLMNEMIDSQWQQK
tara:strand:+ start:820 stop:2313 length:1494 start_codon:yes stop_codon:yes gene_type:complete